MDKKEKQCLENKIKEFDSLNDTFNSFLEIARDFISNDNNNTFGLKITAKNNITYFNGFGHSFFASWRFLIYNNKPTGEICFYRDDETEKEKFFSLFFESKGNARKKADDNVAPYYLKNNEKFEDLFYDIIKSFFELNCFKA